MTPQQWEQWLRENERKKIIAFAIAVPVACVVIPLLLVLYLKLIGY